MIGMMHIDNNLLTVAFEEHIYVTILYSTVSGAVSL